MTSFEARLAEAYAAYQKGDLAAAERIGRELLALRPSDVALNGMLGMASVTQGRFNEAVPFLERALAGSSGQIPLRISLAFALANSGQLQKARQVASGTQIPQLERIVAYVDQVEGRIDAAIARYREVVAGFPEDAESWKNLGVLLLQRDELGEAMGALRTSLEIRFDPVVVVNLAQALARGEHHRNRQELLRDAAGRVRDNIPLLIELGLAEGAMGEFASGEDAYRKAIALGPSEPRAYLELGMMLESLNRVEDMERLLEEARQHGASGGQIDFLEASVFKRKGRFAEALKLAEAIGDDVNPSRKGQLIGEVADRLGDSDRAFAAFREMNRLQAAGPAAEFARSRDLPGEIARTISELTPAVVSRWPNSSAGPEKSPVFLVGFPRSGTTLLDTLLLNLPDSEVLEETPFIERLETEIGGTAGLAELTPKSVEALRSGYWSMVDLAMPERDPKALLIDKFPLHLVRIPTIHALFPDARIIMAERHPCDVVLSCFMSRFQINRATVHFHTIEDAALLYDLAMRAWERATELLPLKVHKVRYEELIASPAAEMQALVSFVGANWDDAMLDHQESATRRGHIPTASYAQVAEPLYTRAAGRWRRYSSHLAPVLPLLGPWAEKMGYEV